jgi:biopolymer transport protein TolR
LKVLKQDHPDVSLYLRADREVPYGVVVQVMDGVKKAGIEKIGMVTDPVGPERIGAPQTPRLPSRKD